MDILIAVAAMLVIALAAIHLVRMWKTAVMKRDVAEALKPGAGCSLSDKKPSAFWFLFK